MTTNYVAGGAGSEAVVLKGPVSLSPAMKEKYQCITGGQTVSDSTEFKC